MELRRLLNDRAHFSPSLWAAAAGYCCCIWPILRPPANELYPRPNLSHSGHCPALNRRLFHFLPFSADTYCKEPEAMIELTKLNGNVMMLNSDLIKNR